MLKQLSLHLVVVVVELRSNKMFESLQYACDYEHKSAKKAISRIIYRPWLVQEKLLDRKKII